MSSTVASLIGATVSRSARSSCWLPATKRRFIVVWRCRSTSRCGSTPLQLADQLGDLAAGWIAADDRDELRLRAEPDDVAHDVAGAAQHRHLALDAQHRDRRLGRDAVDMAVDEAVEHQVADAQDADVLQPLDMGDEVGVLGHGGDCSRDARR